jgi:putative ABC transport system ATP-binding protein
MNGVLYELSGVRRVFRQGDRLVEALAGVDLAIARGEFLALQGASGSGKTTLLQLLGGLDQPSAGSVRYEENDLGSLADGALSDLRLHSFGYVFQQFNLIPTLTARENVQAALAPHRVSETELRARADTLLEEVGLTDRATHLPGQLSGGEQQRVAIARALVGEPTVVLADEPTGNLDTKTGAEIVELLERLAADRGATVVVATHDVWLAGRAPRRVLMRDGTIVAPD